jgi:hypothetical protein
MPKFDPKQFKLLKRSPAGRISAKEILAESVPVDSGSAYTIVDAATGKLPPNVGLRICRFGSMVNRSFGLRDFMHLVMGIPPLMARENCSVLRRVSTAVVMHC